MSNHSLSRRQFLKQSSIGSAFLLSNHGSSEDSPTFLPIPNEVPLPDGIRSYTHALDLSPAKWIWYLSKRCLPNTFVLFRKEITIKNKLKEAKGWILVDSRYIMTLNGHRIQTGPAPADPRFYPHKWNTNDFLINEDWLPAMVISGAASKPSIYTSYRDYLYGVGGESGKEEIRARSIGMPKESEVYVKNRIARWRIGRISIR